MRVLVTGANGQLGKCLQDNAIDNKFSYIFLGKNELDIANFSLTERVIKDNAPDFIINAAAYTNVEKAEEEKKEAELINNLAVENLAKICKSQQSFLIHISTDYIFDGKKNIGYKEADRPSPVNFYGLTKLMGENAIQRVSCSHLILRPSWIFSEYGSNFLKTMLALGNSHKKLKIINDQFGSPTYGQDLAATIYKLISTISSPSSSFSKLFHYSGHKRCSWHTFAKTIFLEAKLSGLSYPEEIEEISSSEYKSAVIRPENSYLNCSKINKEFNIEPSNWEIGIKKAIKSLAVLG